MGTLGVGAFPALAQIVPDNTLAGEASIVVPGQSLRGLMADRIEGGAIRGSNLFHSFSDFHVATGAAAYFSNPIGVENILTRVTGSQPSSILGRLGVLGSANLFLLNPNGIIFGAEASLDIAGSFTAATASAIQLGTGQFRASQPETSQLLAVQPGALFLDALTTQQASLSNRGRLIVGKDLTLAAANLDLQGQLAAGGNLSLRATDQLRLRDSVSNPAILQAGRNLLVQGDRSIDLFTLNHPASGLIAGADLLLRSANPVGGDARYWAVGNFRIEQLDGQPGNLFSPYDPIIRSQGDVSFSGYQGSSLHILAGGRVAIDTVVITSSDTVADTINPTSTPTLANVTLSDGTPLVINGNARPTLDIRAGMDPAAIGTPLGTVGATFLGDIFFTSSGFLAANPVNNPTATSADITIGDAVILAPGGMVYLTNQFAPNRSLTGGRIQVTGAGLVNLGVASLGTGGDGSQIVIDSRSTIQLDASLDASSLPRNTPPGNGGPITLLAAGDIVQAADTVILSGGRLGGAITLKSGEAIRLNGDTFSITNTTTTEKGGTISLSSRSLALLDGARVIALTTRNGTGGDILVTAIDGVQVSGTSASGQLSTINTQTSGSGAAGNLTLATGQLTVQGGGQIFANSFGAGGGGNLTVNATDILLDGTNLATTFASSLAANAVGSGNAGILKIASDRLTVQNGAQIGAGTFAAGNGGVLDITATESLLVRGQARAPSAIFTAATSASTGKAGTVAIRTGQLRVQDRAEITASANGTGDGGNLGITANQVLVQEGGGIVASTFGSGRGGTLTIAARDFIEVTGRSLDGLTGSRLSVQSAATATGNAGNLILETGRLTLQGGAQIDSSTFGSGQGGNLSVNATGLVEAIGTSLDGNIASGLFANAAGTTANAGNGGVLAINTPDLIVREGAQLGVGTFGTGNGGRMVISAPRSVLVSGRGSQATSALFSASSREATGNAGEIQIATGQLTVEAGGTISTSTASAGEGGNLQIQANSLLLNSGGDITSSSRGAGKAGNIRLVLGQSLRASNGEITAAADRSGGGDIFITAKDVQLRDSSLISTSVSNSTGGGGNITIQSDLFLALEDSDILANADLGAGGNITINSEVFLADLFSTGRAFAVTVTSGNFAQFRGNNRVDISASSRVGISGQVNIPDFSFLQNSLASLAGNFVSPDQVVAGSCLARRSVESGSFVVTGTGGIPATPLDPKVSSRYNLVQVKPLASPGAVQPPVVPAPSRLAGWQPGEQIREAQRLVSLPDGRIVAMADLPQRAEPTDLFCHSDN